MTTITINGQPVEATRIDELAQTVLQGRDHVIPAMREGLTVRLAIAQILGLITLEDLDGKLPALNVPYDDSVTGLDGDPANLQAAIEAIVAAAAIIRPIDKGGTGADTRSGALLELLGGVESKTANYTVTVDDNGKVIRMNDASGSLTVNLPPAADAGDGFRIVIKKTSGTSNTVTIDANGTETIDSALTRVLRLQGETVALVCEGGLTWRVMGQAEIFFEATNANGSYIRFASGLQRCFKLDFTMTRVGNTSAQGTWTLPAPFANTFYNCGVGAFPIGAGNYTGDVSLLSLGQVYYSSKTTADAILGVSKQASVANWASGAVANVHVWAEGPWF